MEKLLADSNQYQHMTSLKHNRNNVSNINDDVTSISPKEKQKGFDQTSFYVILYGIGVLLTYHLSMTMDSWSIVQNFKYGPHLPIHSPWKAATIGIAYFMSIQMAQRWFKNRSPIINSFVIHAASIHNLFLHFFSFLMLQGLLKNGYYIISERGLRATVADDPNNSWQTGGPFMFWGYVFYISKIYEFIDTIFLVIRKRPVIFLHVYHHAITLFFVGLGMYCNTGTISIGFWPNCLVHVLMYFHYFLSSLGKRPPDIVSQLLTITQMIQFVAYIFMLSYWKYLSLTIGIYGDISFFWVGTAIVISYLVLFLQMYFEKYSTKGKILSTYRRFLKKAGFHEAVTDLDESWNNGLFLYILIQFYGFIPTKKTLSEIRNMNENDRLKTVEEIFHQNEIYFDQIKWISSESNSNYHVDVLQKFALVLKKRLKSE